MKKPVGYVITDGWLEDVASSRTLSASEDPAESVHYPIHKCVQNVHLTDYIERSMHKATARSGEARS